MTADDILDALIAISHDKIWAVELPFRGSSTRIDFWTLATVRSKAFRTIAYEIKISRADFRRDNEKKQRGALHYSDRFFYVTPPSLVTRDEVPEWAGLMEWHGVYPEPGFKVVKKAPMHTKSEPDWGVIVDIIRNSGQCRRDISLIMSQLNHFKGQCEHAIRTRNIRVDRDGQKFMKRHRALPGRVT